MRSALQRTRYQLIRNSVKFQTSLGGLLTDEKDTDKVLFASERRHTTDVSTSTLHHCIHHHNFAQHMHDSFDCRHIFLPPHTSWLTDISWHHYRHVNDTIKRKLTCSSKISRPEVNVIKRIRSAVQSNKTDTTTVIKLRWLCPCARH
jgi:hypothetical protein